MISITLRLTPLLMLVILVTPDPVIQYVEGTKDLSVTVQDAEDNIPIYQVMDMAGRLLKMTRDLVGAEVKTVLDSGNILTSIRLASLTMLGLYILSSISGMIVPMLLFYAVFSFPDFFNRQVASHLIF